MQHDIGAEFRHGGLQSSSQIELLDGQVELPLKQVPPNQMAAPKLWQVPPAGA